MSESKGFYEGLIYATADHVREKHGVYKLPSVTENRHRQAGIYVDMTEKILDILKEDEERYWDLPSLQQKLGFVPNETLDDSEIHFILNCLMGSMHIEGIEQQDIYGHGTSVYYRLPFNYWLTRENSWPNKLRRGFNDFRPLLTLTAVYLGIYFVYDTIKKK